MSYHVEIHAPLKLSIQDVNQERGEGINKEE